MKKRLAAFAGIFTLLVACHGSNTDDVKGNDMHETALPGPVTELYKAVRLYPDSNNLRLQLAYILDSLGMAGQAVKQMDTVVTRDSTNYKLWLNRGSIAEDAKDTLKAMESYAKALHIYESPDGLLDLANLYAETKNPRALLICARVKDMGLGREYDASAAFISGVYYARTHNKNAALTMFNDCIANNYTYMEAYIEKGLVYFDSKQYDSALTVFNFAGQVNNLYADAYYYQGRCYEMLNKKDSAIMRFKQSLSLDKTLTEAQFHLKTLGAE
ncbi:MAG TPA: tetratricopeptide repeat protein [Chitinophagaceae bacterium]|nr:tetratricopeptide repeat protein [Chitinophagaceae bacterium]